MEEGSLYDLYIQYTSKHDTHYLEAFLTAFNSKYASFLSEEKNTDKAPLLRELPPRLLQILIHELTRLIDALKENDLSQRQIERFVKLFVTFCILTRNPENVHLLSSPGVFAIFIQSLNDVVSKVALLPPPALNQQHGQKENIYTIFKLNSAFISTILDHSRAWHQFAASNCQKFPLYPDDANPHSENTLAMRSILSDFSSYLVDQLEKHRESRPDLSQAFLMIFGSALSGPKQNASFIMHDSRIVRCLLTIVAQLPYSNRPDETNEGETEQVSKSSISESDLDIRRHALRCLTLLIYLLSAKIVDVHLDFTVVVADCLEAFSKLKPATVIGVKLLQLILDAFCNICNVDTGGHTSSCLVDLHLVSLLSNHLNLCIASDLPPNCANDLAVSAFRVLRSLLRFLKPEKASQVIVDWPDLFAVVRKIANPPQKVFDACLNLSHPEDTTPGAPHTLVAREMILWLPHLSNEQQIILSDRIRRFLFDSHSSELDILTCSQHKIVDTILSIGCQKTLNGKAFLVILEILYKIGAVSLSADQLRHLVMLCRPVDDEELPSYALPLLQSLRLMLKPATEPRPSSIFAFHTCGDGLHIQKMHKLPTRSSFSIFTWLRLTPMPATRLIFRLSSKNGNTVEAEILSDGLFLITQSSPKASQVLARLDASALTKELKWRSLCVVFTPVRFIASGRVLVYIDGRQLVEPCQNSFKGLLDSVKSIPTSAWNGLSDLLSDFRIGCVELQRNNGPWLMGDFLFFDQAIQQDQISVLTQASFNELGLLSQSSKMAVKPIIHYTARCYDQQTQVLEDLCGNGYFALCSVSTFSIFDVKDMFGCIGGPGVLFPFIFYTSQSAALSRKNSSASVQSLSLPTRRLSECHSDSNSVAACACACLTELLTGIACGSTISSINWMLAHDGFSILGYLLGQLSPDLISVDVLTSIQTLIDRLYAQQNEASSPLAAQKIGDQHESIANSLQQLLNQAYQHILFNFDIWAKADYVVQVGHLQYIQQLIRPLRSWFRQQYPLRYFLDIVRLFFAPAQSPTTPVGTEMVQSPSLASITSAKLEPSENPRQFIWQIVRIYLSRNASFHDVHAIMGFLSQSPDELILECLDTVKACLDVDPQPDQLVLLMYEPQAAELLFSFLVTDHSVQVREKVVQVINLLLLSKRVYETHKNCFQLVAINFYGLLNRMPASGASESLLNLLFFPMFYNPENVDSLSAVLNFMPRCTLEVQRVLLRKLISHCRQHPNLLSGLINQGRWQPVIGNLFVRRNYPKLPRPYATSNRPDILPSLTSVSDDTHLGVSGHLELCLESSTSISPTSRTDNDVALIDLGQEDVDMIKSPQIEEIMFAPPNLGNSTNQLRTPSSRPASSASSIIESVDNIPLSESERAVLSALMDFTYLTLSSAMPRLLYQDQIKEVGILLAYFRDLESHKPLFKSPAAMTARLLTFMAQQMVLTITNTEPRSRSPSSSDNRTRNPSTSSLPNKSAISKSALSHFIDLVYDSATSKILNKPADFFTPDLLGVIAQLLSLAGVWDDEKMVSVGQIGLAILLQFCCQPDLDLTTAAAEQVQTLLQTSCFIKEAVQFGYLITEISEAALNADSNVYYTLMPILKTALARMRELVDLRFPLPTLQFGHGSFSESFQSYAESSEWNSFMNFQALPWKSKFIADYLSVCKHRIESDYLIWHSDVVTRAEVMSSVVGGSWASFQELILHPFMAKTRVEHARIADFARVLIAERDMRYLSFQHLAAFQFGDCGSWCQKTVPHAHWKLGGLENKSRMRMAMVHNFAFSQHAPLSADVGAQVSVTNNNNNQVGEDFSGLDIAIKVDESARNDDDDSGSVSAFEIISPNAVGNAEGIEMAVEAAPSSSKAFINEMCDLVSITGISNGKLEVTSERFSFTALDLITPSTDDDQDQISVNFLFSEVKDVYLRRFNLRKTALEVFLVDCRNFMFNFADKPTRNKVYVRLIGQKSRIRGAGGFFTVASQNAKTLLKSSGATQRWINREMSNFDYLMALNTFAGRTYNDLSQYMIFPWIIADYSSKSLDLNNPKTYRDLGKPMGVQNERREEEIRDKYDHFEDPTGVLMHKFHYGTHYSNAATVMYYLIRVEPFATLHIDLQSGHFDVPDRLFNSIPALWKSLFEGNDVKELIPEFFYMPEMLINLNKFQFGTLQLRQEKVDDVYLPPWADSPEDFIYKHRQALESDYVSNHLHLWIDLIFGFKQRGQAAIDALNVYHACTYEDQVDLESIDDPEKRKAIEMMVTHFGQTPSQLFTEPHSRRLGIDELFKKVAVSPTQYSMPLLTSPFSFQLGSFQASATSEPILYMSSCSPDLLVSITRSGSIRSYSVAGNRADVIAIQPAATDLHAHSKPSLRLASVPKINHLAVLDGGHLIAVVGYHDNSLRLVNAKSGKLIAAIRHHALPVTCLSVSRCGRFLASGSADVTVAIFRLTTNSSNQTTLMTSPHCILYGHDSLVTAVALNGDLDMCWSAADNGLALAHTVRKGRFLRSMRLAEYLPGVNSVRIENVKIGPGMNEVVFYATSLCQTTHNPHAAPNRFIMCSFTSNGRFLSSITVRHSITDFVLADDAIIWVDSQHNLSIRKLYKYQQLSPVSSSMTASTSEMKLEHPVTALALSSNFATLFVALDNGQIVVMSVRAS